MCGRAWRWNQRSGSSSPLLTPSCRARERPSLSYEGIKRVTLCVPHELLCKVRSSLAFLAAPAALMPCPRVEQWGEEAGGPRVQVLRKSFNLSESQLPSLEKEHNNLTYSSRLLFHRNKTTPVGNPQNHPKGLTGLLTLSANHTRGPARSPLCSSPLGSREP